MTIKRTVIIIKIDLFFVFTSIYDLLSRLRQQKTHFCLPTKVRFLNDVCLRQMMWASPMMTASPNDVCLRAHRGKHRIIAERSGATSYLRSKCIISPKGDASFDKQPILWYNSGDRRCSYERKQTR